MSDEKTEQPTRRKLKDARKKGTVTKSGDLVAAVLVLVVIAICKFAARPLLDGLHQTVNLALDFCTTDRSTQALTSALMHMLATGAIACCAVSIAAMLAAALTIAAQVGVQIAFDPVIPKFDRLSPATGFKKIFSKRSMIDLLKMTIKALVIGVALWKTMVSMFPLITTAMYEPLTLLSAILWSALLKLLFVTAVLFLAIGAGDWKIQHWLMLRSQRMSKDEVKREMKEREGEPKLKRERRKRAKEMINGGGDRQAAVARSNVVVVNPTHYAVALRYAPDESPLPVVLAKGVDADALEIRRLAARFDVPIVANPPVARALHKVDEHASIPPELFQVVAAILRWVQSMRPPPARESATPAEVPGMPGGGPDPQSSANPKSR